VGQTVHETAGFSEFNFKSLPVVITPWQEGVDPPCTLPHMPLACRGISGVVEGGCGGMASPQIIWKGDGIPPNNQASRGDAIAVASPQIKLVATNLRLQGNLQLQGPPDLTLCKCEKVNQKAF
jgi:hypothetical protein